MKKIIVLTLALVLCFGLCACGEKGNAYKQAVYNLESIIEYTCLGYTKSELNEQHRLENDIEMYEYINLPDLYQRFSELGNYKQSKEILSRFSIVENGFVTVKRTFVDAFGQEQSHEGGAVLIDAQGRVAVVFDVSGNGTIYAYDEQENVIREGADRIHKYNDRGERIETYTFSYRFDGIETITNYSYDTQGNCVEATRKNYDGTTYTITYTYDEKGNCIEKLTTYANGVTDTVAYTYIYDEQGNCLFRFSNEDIDEGYQFIVYSQTGNMIFAANYATDAEISDYHYENGLPVSITFSDGNELTFEYAPAYFFDVEGFVLPEV